tara:strand:+ start:3815 stop:4156 length:342 start_codon:yes stop_codon:yes gene_type:complete
MSLNPKRKPDGELRTPFPNHSFGHHALTSSDDLNPENLPILPDICEIIVSAIEASDDGLTIGALKKQSQSTAKFGRLIDLGVTYLVANKILAVETRAAEGGGRGRPKKVLKIS